MGMYGRLQQITKSEVVAAMTDPSAVSPLLDNHELPGLDLDKAWQGIHFLLNGDPYSGDTPLADVVMGGEPVGSDMGYGPARVLTPTEVAEANAALQPVSGSELAERYNPAEFSAEEIYPFWEPQDEDLEYILSYFEPLKAYYAGAAANGRGMLLAIV